MKRVGIYLPHFSAKFLITDGEKFFSIEAKCLFVDSESSQRQFHFIRCFRLYFMQRVTQVITEITDETADEGQTVRRFFSLSTFEQFIQIIPLGLIFPCNPFRRIPGEYRPFAGLDHHRLTSYSKLAEKLERVKAGKM